MNTVVMIDLQRNRHQGQTRPGHEVAAEELEPKQHDTKITLLKARSSPCGLAEKETLRHLPVCAGHQIVPLIKLQLPTLTYNFLIGPNKLFLELICL